MDEKRKVWKPRKWNDPEELVNLINDYLERTPFEEITVTWLCLEIWASKQLLIDYESREWFSEIISKAKNDNRELVWIITKKTIEGREIYSPWRTSDGKINQKSITTIKTPERWLLNGTLKPMQITLPYNYSSTISEKHWKDLIHSSVLSSFGIEGREKIKQHSKHS